MLSLHPLIDRKLLIDKEGKYYGNIPPGKEYKRCKAVIFQEFCPSTKLGYDVMISWLQKSIRRCLVDEALYVAIHLAEMKGIFLSNLLNRLMTILSEDVGPANPTLASILYPLYKEIKENRPETGALREDETLSQKTKRNIYKITHLLAKSPKSRITDWIIFEAKRIHEAIGLELEEDEIDIVYEKEDIDNLVSEFYYRIYDVDAKDIIKAMGILQQVNNLKVSQIRVKRTDGKAHPIWNFWDILIDHSTSNALMLEIKALYNLYDQRDDILHLVHALTLVFYDVWKELPANHNRDHRNFLPVYKDRSWNSIYEKEIPVMNDAIDAHTKHGKKFLGRDLLFFLEHGCKLENHYKFPNEVQIYEQFLKQETAKKEQHLVKEPRDYQKTILSKAIEFFDPSKEETEETEAKVAKAEEDEVEVVGIEGCLHMACGTGKSLTSFWIVNEYIRRNNLKALKILVVTPRLQVLAQFYRVYRDSLIYHKHKSVVGVMCSDFDKPKPHDLCYHLHLKTQEDLDEFYDCYLVTGCQYDDDVSHNENNDDDANENNDNKANENNDNETCYDAVVMFTTYKSLDKIKKKTTETNGIWDLIIYDEAHHMTDSHRILSKKRLLLSATPRLDQTIIASYTYNDAIAANSLVPYTLHVAGLGYDNCDLANRISNRFPNVLIERYLFDDPNDFIEFHFNKGTCNKLIVFSSTNVKALKLYDDCKERMEENGLIDLDVQLFYIDHKTRMKDREPIIKQWIAAKKGIFFNCSILGEGVDFPSVDAIYIESGHISQKMVIQAAGRPLRLDPANPSKIAHIFLSFSNDKEYADTLRRISYL